jgi:flagellar biosynthesis anti-sigma factor FlgM
LPGEDQTELSGVHVQVAALAAQASQLPELREERVESLRQAISSGEYRTDCGKVASALMTHLVIRPLA